MNLKIIIVSHEPLTKRTYAMFNIDGYFQKGFDVEYWNISELLGGISYLPNTTYFDFQKNIVTVKDLNKEVNITKGYSKCILILEFPLNWKNRSLLLLLSTSHKALFQINFYANTSLDMNLGEKLKNAIHENFLKKVRDKIGYYLFHSFKRRHHISINNVSSKADSILKINHPDYESYRDEKERRILSDRYIVFIDTFFPYHPDFKYLHDRDLRYLSNSYFGSLNSFFQYVENKYNLSVIIAAHPKAEYTSEFGRRKIIKNETLNLIRYAEIVLIHASNAISYIVLANKPFVFITNTAYSSVNFLDNRLRKLAALFHARVENIDEEMDIQVNYLTEQDRKTYMYTYLTDENIRNSRNIDLLTSYFTNEDKYNNTSL